MLLDEVGFEPTSANTVDLKSTPLDQTRALILILRIEFLMNFMTPEGGLEPPATRLKAVRSTN